jgi:hypothetical protein
MARSKQVSFGEAMVITYDQNQPSTAEAVEVSTEQPKEGRKARRRRRVRRQVLLLGCIPYFIFALAFASWDFILFHYINSRSV